MGYWEDRQEQAYLAAEQKAGAYFKELEASFRQAKREIEYVINDFYTRYSDANGVSYQQAQLLLSKAEIGDLNDYIKKVYAHIGEFDLEVENMSIKARITRYQALEAQVNAILNKLYAVDYEQLGCQTLKDIYEEGYFREWFNIDQYKGFHSNFAGISPELVDSYVSYPFNGANFSTRLWKQKDYLQVQLMESMTTMIITGAHPRTLTRDFAKKFNAREFDAYRLLHTEASFMASQATHEMYKQDRVEKYQVIATLDSKTCEICRPHDNKVYDVDKAVTGVNMPPFHCFCRCTDVAFYDDEDLSDQTRAARDADGTLIEVPADMNYEEWHEKFIDTKLDAKDKKAYNQMRLNFPDETMKVKGVTQDVKKQLDNAVEKLSKEYDIRINSITVEPAGLGDIFVSGWYDGKMALVINENADFNAITRRIQARYNSGFFAGKSLEDYVAHEMFHVMMYQGCTTEVQYRAKYAQVESLYENLKGISGYADKERSGNEALAEAFVRLRNGEKVPSIAKVLVESYIGGLRK